MKAMEWLRLNVRRKECNNVKIQHDICRTIESARKLVARKMFLEKWMGELKWT